jgi:hypothetical protein
LRELVPRTAGRQRTRLSGLRIDVDRHHDVRARRYLLHAVDLGLGCRRVARLDQEGRHLPPQVGIVWIVVQCFADGYERKRA